MRVLSVPPRLRLATSILALAVPIAAAEVLLVTRAPWWRLPQRSIELWSASVALILFPLAVWINHGKVWGYYLLAVFAALWCSLTAVMAVRLESPGVGFYLAFLLAYWGSLLTWIRFELEKSYFDPRMRWFQGAPATIPGLECRMIEADPDAPMRVSRMDEEGAFLVRVRRGIFRLQPSKEAEMIFTYRDKQVRCRGVPIRAIGDGKGTAFGAGFQFRGMSADSRKELGDFVEALRGEGHV
jgi:hypothetical protein